MAAYQDNASEAFYRYKNKSTIKDSVLMNIPIFICV